jgi:peptidyl-prolyl cis-trans isomerase D
MLDLMRRKKQTIVIKVVFIIIVLSFIGTMFLVWGKGSDGTGRSGGYAAKVDGSRIGLDEYQNALQRLRSIYQQIYGQSLSSEMEKFMGLRRIALDNLIDNRLALKEAKSMGIKVSDDDVAKSIEAVPAFQKDGKFDFNLYQQLLKGSRITPRDFEAGQKEELTLQKVRQAVKDKVTVSDDEALAQYKKENDKIDLEYVGYAPADVTGEVKLTEADLNDYLQKNQETFRTPEKVALSYIVLDPSTQTSHLTLSDEEIQTFYQKNIDRWQGKDGGILPLTEVRDRVKTEALKQKAAKQAFELAADTLYKNIKSGDLNLIAGQLKLKVQETPLFSDAAPPAALAGEAGVIKKALELKQGELGGPVEPAKGIYILKARERKAAAVPPLAEIKAAVEQKAKEAKAVELAKKKAEDVVKQLAGKATLKTRTTGSFGYSAKGEVPTIGPALDLMEAVFKLSAGQAPATPFKVGSTWYAVRLKSRTDSPRGEFDKAKEQVKQKLLPRKQEEALAAWTKGLRGKAKIEINQALVAEK